MLRPPIIIPASFVHGMLSGLQAQGAAARIGVDEALAESGIPAAAFRQGSAQITAAQYVALFRLLMERMDDECLGLLSRPLKPGSFALTVHSTLGAPTLGAALRRLARSFGLLQDDVALVNRRHGELAGLVLDFADPKLEGQEFLHGLLLRVFWRLLAWLHGARLAPRHFDFSFAAPPHAASYPQVFPGTLAFGQPHSAVWFDAAALAAPMRRSDRALRSFLQGAPANVIEPWLSVQTLSSRVRALLEQRRPEWPELAAVARALHMSASTLQRNLAAEGGSFQALKDGLRRDLAIQCLNTDAQPLAAIAADLGFADSAAFQRAFKAWTGSAPGRYRRLGPARACAGAVAKPP
jgi:AraC-like DNA-binding protein